MRLRQPPHNINIKKFFFTKIDRVAYNAAPDMGQGGGSLGPRTLELKKARVARDTAPIDIEGYI